MPAKVTFSNPATVHAPVGYTHAVHVAGETRRLMISGQVGLTPDGNLAASPEDQVAQVFLNLEFTLKAHDMVLTNIVKTMVFLTSRELLPAFQSSRQKVFGSHAPASTVLFVSGLADPRFVIEVEAEAVA